MSMRRLDIGDATQPLSEYAQQVSSGAGSVVVTEDGRPVAVLVQVAGEGDLERLSLVANPRFIDIIARSRTRRIREGTVRSVNVRRELGIE